MKLVLATANAGKVREIEEIIRSAVPDVELLPRPEEVGEIDETGDTLEENARLKAEAIASASGLPAVADDTGLEVDALDGAPGVWSSTFAGPEADAVANVAKLLDEMRGVPEPDRTARFTTVALVAWPDRREVSARGQVEGLIAAEPRGDAGFGYDPVFIPRDGDGRTFAEMNADEKHALSHRGRAFRALADRLVAGTVEP